MGYPVFGKVKTIVLPTNLTQPVTIEEYKDLFGIDLKDFIYLDADYHVIKIKAPNTMFLLDMNGLDYVFGNYGDHLESAHSIMISSYTAGSDSATTFLWTANNSLEGEGIVLNIDKDSPFSIDNLMVSISEA